MRLLRTAVFTAVCVVLAAAGHGMASGTSVSGWPLAAGFAGVFAVAAALAGRERTLLSITAALAAGQVALHVLFGLGRHAPDAATSSGNDSLIHFAAGLVCGAGPAQLSAGEAHRIVTTAGIDPATVTQGHAHMVSGADPTSMASMMTGLPSLPMFLGHLLAAVATGWLLRRGEIALFRLARISARGGRQLAAGARLGALRAAMALVRALRAGLPGQLTTAPPFPRTGVDAPVPATGDPLQHMVIRRGPPPVYVRAA